MEELIGLVAVLGGLGLGAFIFGSIFSLIRARINRNNFDEEAFNRLARAFMKHKKESEQRIQNLEAIIAGDDEPKFELQSSRNEEDIKSIEIEDAEPQNVRRETDDNNLRNMLRE